MWGHLDPIIIDSFGVLMLPEAKNGKLIGGQIRFCVTDKDSLRRTLKNADIQIKGGLTDHGIHSYENGLASVRSHWDADEWCFHTVADRPSLRPDWGAAAFVREK